MEYITKSLVDQMRDDMVKWRGLAHKNYVLAKDIQQAYLDKWESGTSTSMSSKTDAEARAANDNRFKVAVSNNQMYDRFTMRDAAVLSAILKMVELGLLQVRDVSRPNNPSIEPLTQNQY